MVPDHPHRDDSTALGLFDPGIDWRQVVEHSPDLILSVDRDGRILYLNKTVPGFTMDQVIGTSQYDYMPPDSRMKLRALTEQVFETGEPVTYEIPGFGPDGAEAWYFGSMSPIVRGGEIIAATIITRDITERRTMEQSIQHAYELERDAVMRLRELDEIKSEFVAKVVHDLRTPITIIDGFVRTLLDDWDRFEDARRLEFLNLAGEASGRLTALVRDILDVASLESGEYRIEVSPFELAPMLEAVVQSMGEVAGRATIRVEEGTPLVIADERRIGQVFSNLLANAAKFSHPGSSIELSARGEGDDVVVDVRDHGIGIEPNDLPKLFQKFSQLTDRTSPTPAGSGLGLYICRTLLEAQGGSIDVASVPGEGSTFTVRLPATT
jgi:PAS domain S-box-containing protein